MKQLDKIYNELSVLHKFKVILIGLTMILFILDLAIIPSYLSVWLSLIVCASLSAALSFFIINRLKKSKYANLVDDDPSDCFNLLSVFKSTQHIHVVVFLIVLLVCHLINAEFSKAYEQKRYYSVSQPTFTKPGYHTSATINFYVHFPVGSHKVSLPINHPSHLDCRFYESKLGFHYYR
jgi:predicted benzoate:H+ symporter BenE